MTKVSVIIPVYNVEKYLRECLDSVINQTLKDIEIICINDGSTDNSGKILDECAGNDNRIKFIHKKNEGVGKTRNLGINKASGEFVCFMDPDDKYPAYDTLELLYNKAKENKVLICGGEFGFFSSKNPEIKANVKQKSFEGYWFDNDEIINYKDYQFDYGYHRFLYDRQMLIKNHIYFPLYKRFQDPPFFVKAMITAGKFYAVHCYTYAYRSGHKKVQWSEEKIIDLFKGIRDNLKLASQYKLDLLSEYSYIRLVQHFKNNPTIQTNITFKGILILNSMINYNPKIKKFLKKTKLRLWENKYTLYIHKLFSIKNESHHKVFRLFGIKIKIKSKKLTQREQINNLNNRIKKMEKEIKNLREKVYAES